MLIQDLSFMKVERAPTISGGRITAASVSVTAYANNGSARANAGSRADGQLTRVDAGTNTLAVSHRYVEVGAAAAFGTAAAVTRVGYSIHVASDNRATYDVDVHWS